MTTALWINDRVESLAPVTSGMLSQSGLINFVAVNVVDGNTANQAFHTDTSVVGAWMQVDFGVGNTRRLRSCRIFPLAANAGIYNVEFSDDAATWKKAAYHLVLAVAGGWNKISWSDSGAHRYWRIILDNTPGAGSYIGEVEFYEMPPVDIATLGLTLSEAPGWLDAPSRQTPNAAVLGRGGATRLAVPQEGVRRLVLRGTVLAGTVATARANIDALKLALLADPLSLTFADNSDRHVFAVLESFPVTIPQGAQGPFVQETLQVEATFSVYDPLTYDNSLQILTNGTRFGLRMPLGTGPVRPLVSLAGAVVNPTVTLNDKDGIARGTLTFTVTNVAGDVLDIDMDAKTAKKNGVSILNTLSAGDFFQVDPIDQAKYGGAGPFIDASGAVITTSYRRTWR
jgi:hypothetical protein